MYNPKYNLSDKKLKAIIKKIKNNKSEIGLHSSPDSSTNLELLLKEKKNLEKIIGGEIHGNRHHMGRFTSGVSYDIWINSKFAYDASFLSNDLSIDISSSKHFFNLYKSNGDESIIEFPTEWMDVQFLNAQAVNKEKFKDELIKKLVKGTARLAGKAAKAGGKLAVKGAKKAKKRLSTQGRADAANKKADKIKARMKARDNLKRAKSNLKKAKKKNATQKRNLAKKK